jgi:hypothetical protein
VTDKKKIKEFARVVYLVEIWTCSELIWIAALLARFFAA